MQSAPDGVRATFSQRFAQFQQAGAGRGLHLFAQCDRIGDGRWQRVVAELRFQAAPAPPASVGESANRPAAVRTGPALWRRVPAILTAPSPAQVGAIGATARLPPRGEDAPPAGCRWRLEAAAELGSGAVASSQWPFPDRQWRFPVWPSSSARSAADCA